MISSLEISQESSVGCIEDSPNWKLDEVSPPSRLMTILEEAYYSLIIVEHDPLLYEDSVEMVVYVSRALKQAARKATVLLFSLGIDPFLEDLGRVLIGCFVSKRAKEYTGTNCCGMVDEESSEDPGSVFLNGSKRYGWRG